MGLLGSVYNAWKKYTPAGQVVGGAIDKWQGAGNEKRDAYGASADQYGQLGQSQKDWYDQGLNKQMGAWGGAANAANQNAGQLGQSSNAENFYADNAARKGALGFAQDQMHLQSANAGAARGINNSSAMARIENTGQQGLLSDYVRHEGELASSADASQRGRLGEMYGEQAGVAQGESGAIGQAYGQSGQAQQDAQKNAIAARLSKAGVSQEEINQLLGLAMGGAKIAAAA